MAPSICKTKLFSLQTSNFPSGFSNNLLTTASAKAPVRIRLDFPENPWAFSQAKVPWNCLFPTIRSSQTEHEPRYPKILLHPSQNLSKFPHPQVQAFCGREKLGQTTKFPETQILKFSLSGFLFIRSFLGSFLPPVG